MDVDPRAPLMLFGVCTGYAMRRVKLGGFGDFGNVLQNSKTQFPKLNFSCVTIRFDHDDYDDGHAFEATV
jgi:hypothetical protein